MGTYFREHPNETPDTYDQYLNAPISVLCSDACPCVDIDKNRWSVEMQESMANPGVSTGPNEAMEFPIIKNRTWNFTGKIDTIQ